MSLDLSSLTNTLTELIPLIMNVIMATIPLIVTLAVVKMLANMFEGFGE